MKIELLQKGAISECKHEDNEFISYIFLVKKKGGKFQPVINLKDSINLLNIIISRWKI